MATRGSAVRRGAAGRWSLVVLAVAVLAALPALIGALPADRDTMSAADLRQAVLDSADVPFSGYAESAGGLSLPLSDRLTDAADLFSDRTTMRTWYRSPEDWRTDVVAATGETGVHRDATGTWTWTYEDATAVRSESAPLALPTAPDLLPSQLGRRLLSEADDDELTRNGARRIAGVDAQGLTIVPSDPAASVERVDVWVDPDTGLPLQVQVYGADTAGGIDTAPALDSRFIDLDYATPAADVVAFSPPGAARVGTDEGLRLLDADRTPDQAGLPQTMAGLDRRVTEGVPRSVGVYGRGVTLLVVLPVPGRFSDGLREQLAAAPGAVVDELGVRLAAGPLSLMVATGPRGANYLLTGTVTLDALASVAGQLPTTGAQG